VSNRSIIGSLKVWLLLAIAIPGLAACQAGPSPSNAAAISQKHFFEKTGYAVKGDFWKFFMIYGGVDSLGWPISEEIEVDGWRVQYFEYGRLEYHPENEPSYRVTVGWLGELLNRRRPPVSPAAIPRADRRDSRYYAQTGHSVSGDFLYYFDTHGGSVRFGLPISEPFLWHGQLSQDFQSARFFWTPAAEEPVTLEDIGRVHLDQMGP
jgi:hypothetical protein